MPQKVNARKTHSFICYATLTSHPPPPVHLFPFILSLPTHVCCLLPSSIPLLLPAAVSPQLLLLFLLQMHSPPQWTACSITQRWTPPDLDSEYFVPGQIRGVYIQNYERWTEFLRHVFEQLGLESSECLLLLFETFPVKAHWRHDPEQPLIWVDEPAQLCMRIAAEEVGVKGMQIAPPLKHPDVEGAIGWWLGASAIATSDLDWCFVEDDGGYPGYSYHEVGPGLITSKSLGRLHEASDAYSAGDFELLCDVYTGQTCRSSERSSTCQEQNCCAAAPRPATTTDVSLGLAHGRFNRIGLGILCQ